MSEQIKYTNLSLEAEWVSEANCKGLNMFPDRDNFKVLAVAKLACNGCVVRGECLEAALDRAEPHGVWGGTTEDERKEILLRRAKRSVVGAYV